MRNRFRWTHFVDLSRHRQKDQFIRARNRIRRAAPVLGGRFYTHDYLHGANGWADVLFLSPRPPLFYNATLRTTRYAYREEVEELAREASRLSGIGVIDSRRNCSMLGRKRFSVIMPRISMISPNKRPRCGAGIVCPIMRTHWTSRSPQRPCPMN